MLKALNQYHTILKNESLKTAPDKFILFLDSFTLLGHHIQINRIHQFKFKIDPKKEIQNCVGFLTYTSKYIYNLEMILRPFYLQLQDTTDFKRTAELQQTFDRVKKELKDGTLRFAIPNSQKPFYILCDASNYGIGASLLQKPQFGKME